ncbi:MAG: baseplate J/gp47 family protein [Clostridia bacterium]|nr:baseplate J/gp47 family protein [Clostridia bacterium]
MVELIINDGTNILDNLWQNLISVGARTRRHDSSHTGLLFSAIATEINVAISLLQSYSNQYSLDTMTDKVLIENMSSQYAIRRLASKSKAILTFYRMEGYTEGIRIPAGFAVKASVPGNIIFKTVSDVYLNKGTQSVSVMAYSLNSGTQNNVDAYTLTICADPNFNTMFGVTNKEPSFGAYNDESISHLQERAKSFRWATEYTQRDIENHMYQVGLTGSDFMLEEYIDGPGTYMICVDTDSDYAFDDVVSRISYYHNRGIQPVYVRATRLYIDMYITVQTAHEVDYTPTEKNSIYNNINNAIQRFFAAYCAIGTDIRINALKAAINNALSGYDIADVEVDIANSVVVNKRNVVEIGNTTKAYPNKILTSLEYVGGE